MTRDELEFSISQYLDGNLPQAEETALEARLAIDAEARALLGEYRGLDRFLRASPVPEVDFAALAGRISEAVAGEQTPAVSYRMHWVRSASALALAACVVIAAGLGIRRIQTAGGPDGGTQAANTRPVREAKQIVVIDAGRLPASASPVGVVAVGPSAAPQDRVALGRYHEDLLSRPSQVIIARSAYAAQDGPTQDGSLLP